MLKIRICDKLRWPKLCFVLNTNKDKKDLSIFEFDQWICVGDVTLFFLVENIVHDKFTCFVHEASCFCSFAIVFVHCRTSNLSVFFWQFRIDFTDIWQKTNKKNGDDGLLGIKFFVSNSYLAFSRHLLQESIHQIESPFQSCKCSETMK